MSGGELSLCQAVKSLFGEKYAKYMESRSHEIDLRNRRAELFNLKIVTKEPPIACPYCYGNKNYKMCGQCGGEGIIGGFLFTDRGYFDRVLKLSEVSL